jgi:hypothetical protein
MGGRMVFVLEGQHDSSQARRASPKGLEGSVPGFQPRGSTLSFIHNLSVGSPPRPIFLTSAFTHPLQSLFPWKHRSMVRTEHRLEAYATLTPSRRHSTCTAIAPGIALGDRSTVRKANGA